MTGNKQIDDETLQELKNAADEIHEIAYDLGLTPPKVNYWLVDHDEINQLAAYDGFQVRYPHWRWGMKYEKRRKQDTYLGGKIFELVNHDTPANAFNQFSNSVDDHKGVIAHVEAHADFFENNHYFEDNPNAADMLERHARIIESYYEDPELDQEEIEEWIDCILCIDSTIDPIKGYTDIDSDEDEIDKPTTEDKLNSLDVSNEVKRHVFNNLEENENSNTDNEVEPDVLAFLLKNGKQYDENIERAEQYEDWQKSILKMLRREAYYFAPQSRTKIMNEGWAAFWESMIMSNEAYAQPNEIIEYADKQSSVLGSPGFNPYKIGKELWEYIENNVNRKEVVDKLLRVKGINWRNFHNVVKTDNINDILDSNRDMSKSYARNYSLLRNQNRGFVSAISKSELKSISRYMFENEKYDSIDEALQDVDYEKGWKKMREIRETHNDITFIDAFLTEEFIQEEKYFAYEHNPKTGNMEVSGTDLESVKKKLLLQITNNGKPKIVAADKNYHNSGELLLKHQYNGVQMNIDKAKKVMKKVFELWGRTVNLKTIQKTDEGKEKGLIISYDGEQVRTREVKPIDDIKADQIDYDTKPDEWL